MVVSTPAILTRRPTADDTISLFPVFMVPTTAFAVSCMVAVAAGTAGATDAPVAKAKASYI